MKCGECKYKWNIGNTEETGSAICSYPSSYIPVQVTDNCHFIPEKKELTCGDCSCLGKDFACSSCTAEDSAVFNGRLCAGFDDKKKEVFWKILMFWKVQGFYDREKINRLIDDFEAEYAKLPVEE